ncbi:hypothetical protein [Curvibacter gracilis]|uniref:hypothetical protein n=1 Tax=Curvibacter gracilis TaxID=230310 RepID=UPI0004B7D7AD|nr:hypothetical protein [Curvibacter gracilis]
MSLTPPSPPPQDPDDERPLSAEEALWVEALYRPLSATEQAELARSPQAPWRLRVLAAWGQLQARTQAEEGRAAAQARFAALLQPAAAQAHGVSPLWAALRHWVQQHVGATVSVLAVQTAALLWLAWPATAPMQGVTERGAGPHWRGVTAACAPWRVQWRSDLTVAQQERALLQLQLQVRSGPDEAGRYTLAGPGTAAELQAALGPLVTHLEANPDCSTPQPSPPPAKP